MNEKTRFYPNVDPNPDFPELEKEMLKQWKEEEAFANSVSSRNSTDASGDNNEFVFYDGPPFANGLPHYGHLLTGYVKDIFARYQTIKGKRVERRFGWDCHGLPAEMGAEKELGISGRHKIMEYGIGKFNDQCRNSVMKFSGQWEQYVERQARWVDFKNDYKTMDTTFMESVLWAFKQLYDKNYVYESVRVMPYSWAAETPLSNFETHLDNSYRERTDKAVTVGFELTAAPEGAPQAKSYKLWAWTTTPWTLPSNLALAVSPTLDYQCVVKDEVCHIIASYANETYAPQLEGGEDAVVIKGEKIIGLSYSPLFPYFKNQENAFKVLSGDFIEEGEGTGVVHLAPGFGEDDQRICADNDIGVVCPVDNAGKYTEQIFDINLAGDNVVAGSNDEGYVLSLSGLNVIVDNNKNDADVFDDKQIAKYGLANLRVVFYLKQTGKLIKEEEYKHNYPHCWRTDQPLIYKALPSWYVKVTAFKERMVELNQQINWIPSHIKDGQFGKWLSNARDWSISRNRFWGAPIPIWRSTDPNNEKLYVFGSIKELEEFFGTEVKDLHRPFIDNLVKPDPDNPDYELRRVEEVFDCWFESGSMPYAQVHYPFENKEWFENHFPADFIVEYVAQTRGWFYTLMVLSTALFDRPPFLNCICHGVVLDGNGQKLSKRLNNYADPMDVFGRFGADAMRWVMISAPIMHGGDLLIDKEGNMIRDAVRLILKPVWNAYNFFTLYANADGIKADFSSESKDPMDVYILSKTHELVSDVESFMDAYDTPNACKRIIQFFDVLNNWYIRRNKDRFWKSEHDQDKIDAYNTLYTVLDTSCRVLSPLLPLLSDTIWRGLGNNESVHLARYPEANTLPFNAELISAMDRVRDVCNVALSIRNSENIRVRQPLASLTIIDHDSQKLEQFVSLVADEVNVKEILFEQDVDAFADLTLKIHFPVLGKRLPKKMKDIIAASKQGKWQVNSDGAIDVADETLLSEEFALNLVAKDSNGAASLSTNDALVVLDLEVTEKLKQEGLARDLVRLIQQSRKEADLHISDKIKLNIACDNDQVAHAVNGFYDYISDQTLAQDLTTNDVVNFKHSFTQKLDGDDVVINFQVAA